MVWYLSIYFNSSFSWWQNYRPVGDISVDQWLTSDARCYYIISKSLSVDLNWNWRLKHVLSHNQLFKVTCWGQKWVPGSQNFKIVQKQRQNMKSTPKKPIQIDTTIFEEISFWVPFDPLLTPFWPPTGVRGFFAQKSVAASFYPLLSPNFMQKI